MFPLQGPQIYSSCQLFPMYVPCERFETPQTIFCLAANTCLGQDEKLSYSSPSRFQTFYTLVENVTQIYVDK